MKSQLLSFGAFLGEEPVQKSVVFAFGRFQPPTIGHDLLIKKVANLAHAHNARALVFVSNSVDSKKNPLSVEDRLNTLKHVYGSSPVGFVAAPEDPKSPGLFAAIKFLNAHGYKNVILVAGSDRVAKYEHLLNTYNGKEYHFETIHVITSGERDPDDEGAVGASGTKMRAAAASNDFETFRKGLDQKISDNDARTLMKKIRAGLSIKEQFNLSEATVTEGANDKAYFKAVFLLGGTGSGKDFVLDKALQGHGFTEVDTDSAMKLIANIDELSEKLPDDDNERREHIKGKSKSLDDFKKKLSLHGRNGLIINGRGDSYDQVKQIKKALESVGYVTKCIFVSVSDEASKQRNVERGQVGGRSMPEFMRKKRWTETHKDRGRYEKLFGSDGYIEFDNSEDLRRAAEDVRQAKAQELLGIFKSIRKFAEEKPEHPKAKEWLDGESKRRGEPINFTSSVPSQPVIPAPPPKKPGEKAKPPTPADIQKALDGHLGGAEDRDSPAAKKARKLGLRYHGYGRYGKDKPTHVSINGGQGLGVLASIREEQLNELSPALLQRYLVANKKAGALQYRTLVALPKSMRKQLAPSSYRKMINGTYGANVARFRLGLIPGGKTKPGELKKFYTKQHRDEISKMIDATLDDSGTTNDNSPRRESSLDNAFKDQVLLSELSHNVLASYLKKAVQSRGHAKKAMEFLAKKDPSNPASHFWIKDHNKRSKGIRIAQTKLGLIPKHNDKRGLYFKKTYKTGDLKDTTDLQNFMKERGMKEETLNELSQGTLHRYISRALWDKQFLKKDLKMGVQGLLKKDKHSQNMRIYQNRKKGIKTAQIKLGLIPRSTFTINGVTHSYFDKNYGEANRRLIKKALDKSPKKKDLGEASLNELSQGTIVRYLNKAFVKRKSTENYLDHIERKYGWKAAETNPIGAKLVSRNAGIRIAQKKLGLIPKYMEYDGTKKKLTSVATWSNRKDNDKLTNLNIDEAFESDVMLVERKKHGKKKHHLSQFIPVIMKKKKKIEKEIKAHTPIINNR